MILYIIIIERVYLYHVFLEEKTLKLSFVDTLVRLQFIWITITFLP